MKTLRSLLAALAFALRPRILTLDNEAAADTAEIILTIDNAQPGVLRLPFGRYPHGDVTQVINKRTATDMQRMLHGGETVWDWAKSVMKNGFSALWGKPIPVVIGHPNHPSAPTYGSISRMEVLDNELVLHTDWKPEGESLVTGESPKLCAWSPRLKVRMEGNNAYPFAIVHAGLTKRPRIPGATIGVLDNEGGEEPGAIYNIEDLDNSDAVLGGGLELDNDCCYVPVVQVDTLRKRLYLEPDANLEQVNAAMVVREAEMDKSKVDLDALRVLLAAEQQKAVELLDAKNKLSGEITTKDNEAKVMKNSLVAACLKALQASGRLKPVDYTAELGRIVQLDNEAATAALNQIAARAPQFKTASSMAEAARGARMGTLDNEARRGETQARQKSDRVDARKRELMASGLAAEVAYRQAFAEIMN